MPKLKNKNPALGQKEGRAVVRYQGRTHYLKKPDGTPCKPHTKDARAAYNRLCIELQNNPAYTTPNKCADICEEPVVTVAELAAGYLTYLKTRQYTGCGSIQIIMGDFLLALYGDE
jgi:hypothetical protein